MEESGERRGGSEREVEKKEEEIEKTVGEVGKGEGEGK